MITFLLPLIDKLKGWLFAALAILAAIGGIFLYGRNKGKQSAQTAADAAKLKGDNAALQESLDAAKERTDVEIDVGRLPDGDAAERLRNDGWTRD